MDSMEREEAKEWLEKEYKHVLFAKGPDATEALSVFITSRYVTLYRLFIYF